MKWKVILNCNGALGGHEFRVTSNGHNVHIQSRHARTYSWRTDATMPLSEFERRHDELGNGLGPNYINLIACEAAAKSAIESSNAARLALAD